jgi:hypothetical protein
MKKIAPAIFALLFLTESPKASNFTIYDDSFNVIVGTAPLSGTVISAVWGTYNSGTSTFTPNQPVYANGGFGYVDLTVGAPELQIILNRTTQDQYPGGTLLSLAVYNRPDLSDWDPTAPMAILIDPSWTAPAWSLVGGDKDVFFTANTTAALGGFTYSASGSDTITLVPEPSTSALMLIGTAGLVALRRLRKV